MQKPFIHFLFVIAAVLANAKEHDTVKVKPIEVIAVAPVSAVAVTRLTNTDLKIISPVQISEVLSAVPGLYVRDYGGLGGLKSVSVRGGTAAQTLVSIDGVRLNTSQNGGIDLSAIPASFVSSVDVIRGSVSALAGANAMNGAVDFNMSVPQKSSVSALVSGGSFNELRGQASAILNMGTIRFGASLESYSSDGSFSYTINADGMPASVTRSNADISSTSGMLRMETDSLTTVMILGRSGERGVPGAVIQGVSTPSVARLYESDVYGFVKTGAPISDNIMMLYGVGGRYLDLHYTDPQSTITGPQGVDARYINREVSSFASVTVGAGPLTHDFKVDAGYVSLVGESLLTSEGQNPKRLSADGQYKLVWRDQRSHFVGEAAVRGDYFSDVGGALSVFLGGSFELLDQLNLRVNVGSGFRPPSFNELYYLNYGTSSLKPERSITVSIGADSKFNVIDGYNAIFSADVYVSKITDLIVAVPINPVTVSAQNVGSAGSIGLELSARANMFRDRLGINWAYTIQRVVDMTGRSDLDGTLIPYTPVELFSFGAIWSQHDFYARAAWLYTSYRYAQSGEEYSSLMQPYHLVNIILGLKPRGSFVDADISLHIDNLFDASYSVIRGYPMPGRTFRVVLAVQ
ncbi:MAG: TonB-dependent receptor [Ignavibacteria bacterium]|nr:TonB-dependent receptor [Ignavibacteria bacterium]